MVLVGLAIKQLASPHPDSLAGPPVDLGPQTINPPSKPPTNHPRQTLNKTSKPPANRTRQTLNPAFKPPASPVRQAQNQPSKPPANHARQTLSRPSKPLANPIRQVQNTGATVPVDSKGRLAPNLDRCGDLFVLNDADPFNLYYLDDQGHQVFPTFPIDWGRSTLYVEGTINSPKKHKGVLAKIEQHPQYIWPAFVAFKLLDQQTIFDDAELIKILYVHCHYSWETKLQGDALVKAVKKQTKGFGYFHCTPDFEKNLVKILESKCINVTMSAYPGAFTSVGSPARVYGDYMFVFFGLEKEDLPLSHRVTGSSYWAGFWNPIDLRRTLKYIVLPNKDAYRVQEVKGLLKVYGYQGVEVILEKELETNLYKRGTELHPTIVPSFWPGSKGNYLCTKTAKGGIDVTPTCPLPYSGYMLFTNDVINFPLKLKAA